MSSKLSQLIDSFVGLNILVIGEAMLDSYLEGTANNLSPEAPVPVVTLSDRHDAPGGAANVAANIVSLGGCSVLLSVIGDDSEADLLQQTLAKRGISTEHVLTQPSRRTLAKHRIVASSQILVRFDQGSTAPMDSVTEQTFIDRLTYLFPRCDGLIISDYNYGILTPRVISTLAKLQRLTPRLIVVDSKFLTAYREVGVTVVKPNYSQAVRLLGIHPLDRRHERVQQIVSIGQRILDRTRAHIAAVTLDADGALVFERGNSPYRTYARSAQPGRASGAGDTFGSSLTLALAAGASAPTAAEVASAAAAIVVGKEGTATCSAHELRGYVSTDDKVAVDAERLVKRLEMYRQEGRRIVFTNGCFDILHRGHITYLSRAKVLGDILVVGINSDESIRRIKGPTRPINSLEDRVQVLSALSCVDYIIPFEENTPCNLIAALRPDVFVKGGDYTYEELPEAPLVEILGGTVEILPYIDDHSTTGIINRIQKSLRSHNIDDKVDSAERSIEHSKEVGGSLSTGF